MNAKSRISALQSLMKRHGLQGYIVPSSDEQQNEYLPTFWQRRAWITGFAGSVGDFALTTRKAALWIDGRYVLQAERETRGSGVNVMKNWLPTVPTIPHWFGRQLKKGDTVGVDPKVVSIRQAERIQQGLAESGIKFKAVSSNLVDELWKDRPVDAGRKILVHPLRYAGETHLSKLKRLRKSLADAGAAAHIVSAADAVAWLFNLRGRDVPCNPVFVAHAIVLEKEAHLYVDLRKVDATVRKALGKSVRIHRYEDFEAGLKRLAKTGKRVWLDPNFSSRWTLDLLMRKNEILLQESPIVLMKAMKNRTELKGAIAAHVRDGVAVVRFLHWLDKSFGKSKLTELDLVNSAERFRKLSRLYVEPSFDTIAGFGPNGAIVHYRANKETNLTLRANSLVVFDSGAQYPDGTTDITRTLLLGRATREMKERFTLMLKGNLALHLQSFPEGTLDSQLDPLARQFLWRAGLDYQHGTGHGIGAHLCVHEKPQIIGPRKDGGVPLRVGMITSNEPGYYKAGEYGMRNENLVYTTEDKQRSLNGKRFLRLETLTLCPIELNLIDKPLLTPEEIGWIDDYHGRVRSTLWKYLKPDERAWLKKATRKL